MPRHRNYRLTAVVLILAVSAPTSFAADALWSGWLGPNRDGWVSDFEPPAEWPEKLTKVWQVDVGTGYGSPLVAGDLVYQNHPNWGASASPIVDGDRVVVHFGNDDEGMLVAMNVADGKEVWTQGKDGASYSSPLLVEIHGVRQIVDWNHRAIVGVESQTGKQLWEFPFPHLTHNQNMPTPTFHNGRILLGGENRGVHSLEPQLKDGVWSVEDRWFQKQVALDMSTAVINGDLLFGFSHYNKGQLFCLDTESGDVLWQGPGRLGQNVAFLSIPGHVIALLDSGRLQVVKATGGSFDEVVSYPVADSPTWAPPVLLQQGVLIKDQTSLTYLSF
jgi:outer membrane protein assembly factor BamB